MVTEFSKRLRELRKKQNISQRKLAEATGVGQTTLAHYESGRSEPGLENLIKLADYFNVSTDYLIGRSKQLELFKEPT